MNMPLVKAEAAAVTPAATAKVLALPPKRRAPATRTATVLGKVAERVVPPVVVIAVALLIWELHLGLGRSADEGLIDVIELEVGRHVAIALNWRRCRG
jgi:hypothetical protein